MRRYFIHLAAAMAIITTTVGGIAVVGSAGSAQAAGRYACGNQCNGHLPTWPIPSNRVRCSNSATPIKTGHPARPWNDTKTTVTVYYSRVCQTIWAKVTNSGSGFTTCNIQAGMLISPHYVKNTACAPTGHSVTTTMVNDHSPSLGIASRIFVGETKGHLWSQFQFDY